MSKGLKALGKIKYKLCENCPYNKPNMDGDVCSKCEETLEIVEKELKALDIIKEKKIDTEKLRLVANAYAYNNFGKVAVIPITQEEWDLLKEVLL